MSATPDEGDEGWTEVPLASDVAQPQGWRPVPTGWRPAPFERRVGARKERGTIGWDILLGVDLAVVALSVVASIVLYVMFVVNGDASALEGDPADATRDLSIGITANLFLFGIIPLAWVAGTRVGGWNGVRAYLRLHAPQTAWWGVPLAVALVALAIGATLLLDLLGWVEETPNSAALMNGMTWPLVFFVSFVAGTSEEVLFRGILQRWVGWVGQGLLFGLFHLGNGVTGLVATTIIGLLFGFMVRRGTSLWVVVVAHFTYDVLLLSFAMVAM